MWLHIRWGIGDQRGKKASLMEHNREALINWFLVLFPVLLELSLFGLFSRATVWLSFPLMPSTSGVPWHTVILMCLVLQWEGGRASQSWRQIGQDVVSHAQSPVNTHDTRSRAHAGSSHLGHAFCRCPWNSLMGRCLRTKRELGIIYLFLLHFGGQQKLWVFSFKFFQNGSNMKRPWVWGAEFHWLCPLLVWTLCFWTFHKHSIAASVFCWLLSIPQQMPQVSTSLSLSQMWLWLSMSWLGFCCTHWYSYM